MANLQIMDVIIGPILKCVHLPVVHHCRAVAMAHCLSPDQKIEPRPHQPFWIIEYSVTLFFVWLFADMTTESFTLKTEAEDKRYVAEVIDEDKNHRANAKKMMTQLEKDTCTRPGERSGQSSHT